MHGNRRSRFPPDITRMQHPIPSHQLRNATDRELEHLEQAIRNAIQSGRTGPYHFTSLEETLLNIDDVRDPRTGMFEGGARGLDEGEESEQVGGDVNGHDEFGGGVPQYGGGGRGGVDHGYGGGRRVYPHMTPSEMPGYAPGAYMYPGMGHPPMYGYHDGPPMWYGMPASSPYREAPQPGRPHGPIPNYGPQYSPSGFTGSHRAPYSQSGFTGSPGNPYFASASPQPPNRPARKEGPDLYAALGLAKSATKKQIEKEGKRLKMQWHPDRNKEDGAEEKFKLINEATEVLSDDERRRFYDETGETNLNVFEEWKQAMRGFGAGRGRRG